MEGNHTAKRYRDTGKKNHLGKNSEWGKKCSQCDGDKPLESDVCYISVVYNNANVNHTKRRKRRIYQPPFFNRARFSLNSVHRALLMLPLPHLETLYTIEVKKMKLFFISSFFFFSILIVRSLSPTHTNETATQQLAVFVLMVGIFARILRHMRIWIGRTRTIRPTHTTQTHLQNSNTFF